MSASKDWREAIIDREIEAFCKRYEGQQKTVEEWQILRDQLERDMNRRYGSLLFA